MLAWLGNLFSPRPARQPLGPRGEKAAAQFLRRLGYQIVGRNYRSPTGEIDIIARDGPVLVFVEVKTRQEDDPTPEEQVNQAKRHQITKSARFYLSRLRGQEPPARFDVVAVVWPENQPPKIRHTIDAFEATF